MKRIHYKYIILAPSYSPNSGGGIVLHKLCDMLNSKGERAWICPMVFWNYFLSSDNAIKTIIKRIFHPIYTLRAFKRLVYLCRNCETNSFWNTPVVNPFKLFFNFGLSDYIVVYPELLSGNILGAKNVVRYLLHNPGHFTGRVGYGTGELYFRYSNSFARDFKPAEGSRISPHVITISTTPEYYNMQDVAAKREGIAYMVRKGKGKTMVHDVNHSIFLDGKSHEEVAAVLKRVETFISYDPITGYSIFALLCGCKSVIILGEGETPETYHPDLEMRRMFAYSLDDTHVNLQEAIKWAEDRSKNQMEVSNKAVEIFISESQQFFQDR